MTHPGETGYAAAARAAVTSASPMLGVGRRRFMPLTLRRSLLVVLAALLALVSAGVGVVSVSIYHASAVERVDEGLADTSARLRIGLSEARNDPSPALRLPGIAAGTLIALVWSDGTIEASYLGAPGEGEERLPPGVSAPLGDVPGDGHPTTIGLGGGLGDYRVATAASLPGEQLSIVIGVPLDEVSQATTQLAVTIAFVAVFGLLVAIALGWVLVGRTLRPLARVTESAKRVSELPLEHGEVELAERVAVADERTEVGRLGMAFNRMLGHVASALSAREESEQRVRRFVADASHELRTPLASIRGYSELMRLHGGELPDDVMHALGRIEAESVRMTALVEDLLLLARLDEGRELERRPVGLVQIARDAIGDAQAAGLSHEWRLDAPEVEVEVAGDEPRLRQVVVNLLANARVHTPDGTDVTLAVRREGDVAVIEVADTGPGIAPEVADSLFERFARGDSSRSRRAGSTGLGLAIVQAVVDAHDGTVSVSSDAGATRFTVRLPVLADPAQPVTR